MAKAPVAKAQVHHSGNTNHHTFAIHSVKPRA